FSLVAAGILPYLLALSVANACTLLVPALKEARKEGERGKDKVERIATWLSVPIAFLFGWSYSHYLSRQTGLFPGGVHWFTRASFLPSLGIVCAVTAGSALSTWIANRITKVGIASGPAIVSVAGASLVLVEGLVTVVRLGTTPEHIMLRATAVGAIAMLVIVCTVYLMQSQRQIPVQFIRQPAPVGVKRLTQQQSSYLPLLLNWGRTLPISGAIGLLAALELLDGVAGNFLHLHRLLAWTSARYAAYWATLALLIIGLTYLYNFSVLWDSPTDPGLPVAESLRRRAAYIPGVRPGSRTEHFLTRTVLLFTMPAAIALSIFAAGLPWIVIATTGLNVLVPMLSLMVIVIKTESLWAEMQSYRVVTRYQGLLSRSGRLRSKK
ncbi:MAG: hypothetical protein JOZ43_09485, partial [Acidobacteriales bacterium]|nr:hypothetical protein [Terriglobales bacterium]